MLAASDSAGSVIQAHFTDKPPRIDGVIDDVWWGADSAHDFSQLTPDYGKPATEATTVYLLYDRDNVYVAFRCLVNDLRTRRAQMSGESDGIRLFLDTFGDNNSCYVFAVAASGVEQTYRLTDDGSRVEDWSGVWQSSVRPEKWGFAVELALPFKALRYPPNLTSWGIDFGRYVVYRGEKSYWAPHGETGVKVSEMGRIASIRTPPAGLHLEVYPVGLFRFQYDSMRHYEPSGGLDAAWLPTPTANLQLTTFPDFAQIEADPYRVNLSEYELLLPEKRPFFVEAAENFGGSSNTLQLFYSRRIGKPLPDGQVVPILGGAKYTDRFSRFSFGALAAVTGERNYDSSGVSATEPVSIYSVVSLRRLVLDNSQVGFLYAGKDNPKLANHGVGLDAMLREGDFNGSLTLAGSQSGDSLDYALVTSTRYQSNAAAMYMTYKQIAPEFDANGIGLTGWRGQSVEAGGGPEFYSRGPFRYAQARGYFTISREWAYPDNVQDWEIGFSTYADFLNLMSAGAWLGPSRAWFPGDTGWQDYLSMSFGGNLGTDASRPLSTSITGYYATSAYNYRRGILAPNADAQLDFLARAGDHVSIALSSEAVLEFESGAFLDKDEDVTFISRPRLDVAFTPKMNLGLAGEIVRGFDLISERPYTSYYASLLYSWTIRPRSTIYVALNQRLDDTNPDARVKPSGSIAVVKLRYLFVF